MANELTAAITLLEKTLMALTTITAKQGLDAYLADATLFP